MSASYHGDDLNDTKGRSSSNVVEDGDSENGEQEEGEEEEEEGKLREEDDEGGEGGAGRSRIFAGEGVPARRRVALVLFDR